EPVVAIYLDYEMTEDDVHERLADMGLGPDDDLSRLRYWLLPSLPPLDTEAGAAALFPMIDAELARFPDHHGLLVVDTMGRAVAGEENSNDTFRAWWRVAGVELKRRGMTWARTDHAGKDKTRGQR